MSCLLRFLRSRSASIHPAVRHRLVATSTRVALAAAGASVVLAFGVALAGSSDAGAASPAQANAGSAGASQTGPLLPLLRRLLERRRLGADPPAHLGGRVAGHR
jgi:hypothetical protein